MAPQDTPQGKLAFEFATALVMRDFQRAHQMLSQSAQADWPADQLQETHDGMVDYFESPPDEVADPQPRARQVVCLQQGIHGLGFAGQ